MNRFSLHTIAALGLLASTPICAQNLLVNGSFETPAAPSSVFTDFLSPSTAIPGWSVFGDNGKGVSIVSGTFTDRIAFPAQDGAQWLDLTGNGFNSLSEGVSQTVATVAGHRYRLSYHIGNITDPLDVYGTTSTVVVLIDGSVAYTDVNSMTGTTAQVWQQFTHTFTATGSRTTIGFRNGDTPCTCDQHNGFDGAELVDLDAAAPLTEAVPAPTISAWMAIVLAGVLAMFGLIGVVRRGPRAG